MYAIGHVQGIYVKFATSNGKPAWNHTSYDYSLWWGSNGFWMIGPKAEIGSVSGWLYNPMSGPPYGNNNYWFYHNGAGWVNPIGEIKVGCNQNLLFKEETIKDANKNQSIFDQSQQQTKVIY